MDLNKATADRQLLSVTGQPVSIDHKLSSVNNRRWCSVVHSKAWAALPERHTNILHPEDSPSPAMHVISFFQGSCTDFLGCHWELVVCDALAVTVLSQRKLKETCPETRYEMQKESSAQTADTLPEGGVPACAFLNLWVPPPETPNPRVAGRPTADQGFFFPDRVQTMSPVVQLL